MKPRDRLLVTAEMELREACEIHPKVSRHIARAEAEGLADVSLGLFGATDENLTVSDKRMGVSEVSIEFRRMFAFGDARPSTLGVNVDDSQCQMSARIVRHRGQGRGQFRFGRRHALFRDNDKARRTSRFGNPAWKPSPPAILAQAREADDFAVIKIEPLFRLNAREVAAP